MNWLERTHFQPFVFLGKGFSPSEKPTIIFPREVLTTNRRSQVRKILREIDLKVLSGLYAVGWLSYEASSVFLNDDQCEVDAPFDSPLIWFGIFDEYQTLDEEDLVEWKASFNKDGYVLDFESSLDFDEFENSVLKIKQFLQKGDVYQINYTFPLNLAQLGSLGKLFFDLRKAQLVPYEAWFRTGESGLNNARRDILSFSPELFWRRTGREIRTFPMKGTRPRGRTEEEDLRLRNELADSPKDRAENLMITDLLRNDLGRISEFGSVGVPRLFSIKEYFTVFQMVSEVQSVLRKEIGLSEIFEALFPGGSITGAPKLKAVEIIASLEDERGIYTGAIALLSPNGETVSIPIRTLEFVEQTSGIRKGRLGVGAGITIDSEPYEEWNECWAKARFMTESLNSIGGNFSIFTSMVAKRGTIYFLDDHKERMSRSARELGFPFSEELWNESISEIKKKSEMENKKNFRIRMILDFRGALSSEVELFVENKKEGPIIVSGKALECGPLSKHKTTVREIFRKENYKAFEAGYLDAVFLNDKKILLEGSIHSIFLRIDGKWFTPSLKSGILPGVYRKKLLNKLYASETDLSLEDLDRADQVILTNAVRGIRRVTRIDRE
ncbi:para-aminobenzoate synthase, component I family protein [Leptospira fainei serovar Hurstbridge str. BUT 6]|uniref:Para-aminobenzoate synthase, component I family protein n=1 Tax=Leptospira fainei serovar Hurstbridge str. BUT 6 TaxID=1193011 RepID=S3VA56_9LEPT|nr:bifunctional anthranilate synthase component I family protein/class IV aminotransferase [Leptospira fainei]EPG73345.1 para-aminobenzoate synthase, component I family protein [Leptospira fainei serovar Hurstbridge str. BUT 6]